MKMKRLYHFFIKLFLCLVIFLVVGIVAKGNSSIRSLIRKNVYEESISFAYFKNIYNQYLGGVFPIEKVIGENTQAVFKEKLSYSQIESYYDGALLTVENKYLVPSLDNGIVVYIGEKEYYKQVVIIENDAGVDIWYGNLCNSTVKLYDQVVAGTYLGESCSEDLYIVYSKGNEFLNYQDYLG